MARIRSFFLICAICLDLWASAFPAPVQAANPPGNSGPSQVFLPLVVNGSQSDTAIGDTLPSLADFADSLADPSSSGVKGVYAPTIFAYQVVNQPSGNYNYVSAAPDTVTEFGLTSNGVIGLLGHNDLAGQRFPSLKRDQDIYLIYADHSTRRFIISDIHRYQALDPQSTTSDFIDLETEAQISAADLFAQYYMGSEHVTFQTCIEKNGNASWGRLFVVAEPAD